MSDDESVEKQVHKPFTDLTHLDALVSHVEPAEKAAREMVYRTLEEESPREFLMRRFKRLKQVTKRLGHTSELELFSELTKEMPPVGLQIDDAFRALNWLLIELDKEDGMHKCDCKRVEKFDCVLQSSPEFLEGGCDCACHHRYSELEAL